MALVLADRVRETSTTTGTGTFTLAGAVTGFQSFSVIGNANTTYYTIAGQGTNEWEVGIGTYTSAGTTLSRDTVLASSNAGSLVNFSAGTKDVFVTYPAGEAVYYDTTGALPITGPTSIDISSTTAALRVTQRGTGNALLIEDSTNPDSSPIVVDADGLMVLGQTINQAQPLATGNAKLQIHGGTAPLALMRNADSATAINLEFAKRRATGGTLASGDVIGRLYFSGNDGTSQLPAAYIDSAVDGTPGTNDMPGRLVFSTTADGASSPTEAMRIDSGQRVGIGATALTGFRLRVDGNILGSSGTARVIQAAGTIQSDVTTAATSVRSIVGTQATAFTLPSLTHFEAVQGSIGAGSTITSQYGFNAASSLTGATNNYGFYSNIAAATGRWNFYANGTANNYFAGNIGIGITTPAADSPLHIYSTAGGVERVNVQNAATTAGTQARYDLSTGTANAYAIHSLSENGSGTVTYEIAMGPGVNGGMYFTSATTSTPLVFRQSSTERLRVDSSGNTVATGEVQAPTVNATNGIFVNSATISANYTIPSGSNAGSFGPVTVASGIAVTVPSGSVWTVV